MLKLLFFYYTLFRAENVREGAKRAYVISERSLMNNWRKREGRGKKGLM